MTSYSLDERVASTPSTIGSDEDSSDSDTLESLCGEEVISDEMGDYDDLLCCKEAADALLQLSKEKTVPPMSEVEAYFVDNDPLKLDYEAIGSFLDIDDPSTALTGRQLFNYKTTRDVPCPHHDGISGRCFKGVRCPYGHQLNTGGVFAKKNPHKAFAMEMERTAPKITELRQLPEKKILNKKSRIVCKVTHVESPSLFFIRAAEKNPDVKCKCSKTQQIIKTFGKPKVEGSAEVVDTPDPDKSIDFYTFGYVQTQDEQYEKEAQQNLQIHEDPDRFEASLNTFLYSFGKFRKLQIPSYNPNVDLVAARDVKGVWWRAIVIETVDGNLDNMQQSTCYQVQLLDTGMSMSVRPMDICRLPEKYGPAVATCAYKCKLFGIFPVWNMWSKNATKLFKELVLNKTVEIVVKSTPEDPKAKLFEKQPYSLQILVNKADKITGQTVAVDVAQILAEAGYGILLNFCPLRPHILQGLGGHLPTGYHALIDGDQAEKELMTQLEIEQKRIQRGCEIDKKIQRFVNGSPGAKGL